MSGLGDLPRYLARPYAHTGLGEKLLPDIEAALDWLAARGGGTISDGHDDWLVICHVPRSLAVQPPGPRAHRGTRSQEAKLRRGEVGRLGDSSIKVWRAADGVPIHQMPWGRPWRSEGPA